MIRSDHLFNLHVVVVVHGGIGAELDVERSCSNSSISGIVASDLL